MPIERFSHLIRCMQTFSDNTFSGILDFEHFTKQISILQVELGPGGSELSDNTAKEDKERRALDKRKYLAISRRCKEIEQVSVGLFIRQKATGISYKSGTVILKHWMTFRLVEMTSYELLLTN